MKGSSWAGWNHLQQYAIPPGRRLDREMSYGSRAQLRSIPQPFHEVMGVPLGDVPWFLLNSTRTCPADRSRLPTCPASSSGSACAYRYLNRSAADGRPFVSQVATFRPRHARARAVARSRTRPPGDPSRTRTCCGTRSPAASRASGAGRSGCVPGSIPGTRATGETGTTPRPASRHGGVAESPL